MTNAIIPRTLDEVARIARMAHASGLAKVASPEAAGVILLTGAELGLSPMQSLRGIYVVDGKPVLSADLMVAVVRRSPTCASWRTVESTPERCTIETRREGDEHTTTRTWTMADAQRAGLNSRGPWRQYPAQMLRHRCAADIAREVYPDVVLGLYDPDELGVEVQPIDATPVRETPQATAPRVPALEALGIEHHDDAAVSAREAVAERGAIVHESDAVDPVPVDVPGALAGLDASIAAIELPGDALALWLRHRADIAALPEAEGAAVWKALCARTEEVGKMRPGTGKTWIRKAVAIEDARRRETVEAQP